MKEIYSHRKIIFMLLENNFLGRLLIVFIARVNPDDNLFYHYILLWLFMIYLWLRRIITFSKKKDFEIGPPNNSEIESRPKNMQLMASMAMVCFSAILYYLLYGTFKLIYLWDSHMELFGSMGLLTLFSQLLYL